MIIQDPNYNKVRKKRNEKNIGGWSNNRIWEKGWQKKGQKKEKGAKSGGLICSKQGD